MVEINKEKTDPAGSNECSEGGVLGSRRPEKNEVRAGFTKETATRQKLENK